MAEDFCLYTVRYKYIRNLTNVEQRFTPKGRPIPILQNSPQENKRGESNKQGRPYVGIVIINNGRKYCIPFSSLDDKSKYDEMSENITMRKIKNKEGKVIGILNINNMIPVRDEYLDVLDITIYPEDYRNPKRLKFKQTCQEELEWCKEHRQEITRYAEELRKIICSDENFSKRNICPHYDELEKNAIKLKKYPNVYVNKRITKTTKITIKKVITLQIVNLVKIKLLQLNVKSIKKHQNSFRIK